MEYLGVENYNFKDLVKNIEAIKKRYKFLVASFLYFELHKKVLFMKEFKSWVYSLKVETWKKDKVWEYLND